MQKILLRALLFFYGISLLVPGQSVFDSVLPFLAISFIVAAANSFRETIKIQVILVCIFWVFLGIFGFISNSLAAALSTGLLIAVAYPSYATIIVAALILATPFFNLFVLLVAQSAPSYLRPSAQAIMACVAASIFMSGRRFYLALACGSSVVIAYSLSHIDIPPALVVVICNLPFILVFSSFSGIKKSTNKSLIFLTTVLIFHSGLLFYSSNPTWKRVVVWVPDLDQSYESKYFENYVDTLNLVGLNAKRVSSAADVPPESVVLCPWAPGPKADVFFADIKALPYAKSLTIIVAGEHTNYSSFLDTINPIFSSVEFNNDTTVPPGNRDHMGQVKTASLTPFPKDATLNRGASLSLRSVFSTPLIIAEGIFSDPGPKIPNPLWVGDYRLMEADPRGWVLLAANFREGALWSFVGDNSFLLNSQIASNPEPLMHYLTLASNRPAFILTVFLILHALAIYILVCKLSIANLFKKNIHRINGLSIILFLNSLFFLCFSFFENKIYSSSSEFNQIRPMWGAFDVRSYARALVELAPTINSKKNTIFSYGENLGASAVGVSHRSEIHIGFLNEGVSYAGVVVENCRRLGGFEMPNSKIFLMDAKACHVQGDVEILIGNEFEAVAFSTKTSPKITFVMDKAFLAGDPPKEGNVDFVKSLF